MTGSTPNFDSVSVAAILAQRSRADKSALLDDLVTMLSEVVPGVKVERGLIRRRVTAIRLPLGNAVYVLQRGANDAFATGVPGDEEVGFPAGSLPSTGPAGGRPPAERLAAETVTPVPPPEQLSLL